MLGIAFAIMLAALSIVVDEKDAKRWRKLKLSGYAPPRHPPAPVRYPNMRNCTFNDVWVDGKGVPHKLSIIRRFVLWLKFHNPWSRIRRMIRASGINPKDFRYGPVGAQKAYDQCGRDLSGVRKTDWGPLPADPTISVETLPGDTYFNTLLNQVKFLNTLKTAWISTTASGGNATLVVAAVNSRHPERADYQCDGVDDQVEINSAIVELNSIGGGRVSLQEGQFNMSGRIKWWYHNITLEGQGANTIIRKDDEIVTALTANGVFGNTFVDVTSVAGLRVGMTIIIEDLVHWNGMGNYDGTQGEIIDITGNRVTMSWALKFTYNVASTATLRTSFPLIQNGFEGDPRPGGAILYGWKLKNFKIDGNAANQTHAYGQYNAGTWTTTSYYCEISGVQIYNWASDAFAIQDFRRGTIRNTTAYSHYGKGYHFSGCISTVIEGNVAYGNRQSYTVAPFPNQSADYSFCSVMQATVFANNTSDGGLGRGLWLSTGGTSHDNLFVGNSFYNTSGEGIYCNSGGTNNNFVGNNFYMAGYGSKKSFFIDGADELNIVGCKFRGSDQGNTIDYGIYATASTDIQIKDCFFKTYDHSAIYAENGDHLSILDNTIVDIVNEAGVHLKGCTNSDVKLLDSHDRDLNLETFEAADGTPLHTYNPLWTVTSAGASYAQISTAAFYAGASSLKMYRDGANDVSASLPINLTGNYVRAKCFINAAQLNGYLNVTLAVGAFEMCNIGITTNVMQAYYGNHAGGVLNVEMINPVVINTWYEIWFDVDLANNRWKAWVNGIAYPGPGADINGFDNFRNDGLAGGLLDNINIFNTFAGAPNTTFYVDQLSYRNLNPVIYVEGATSNNVVMSSNRCDNASIACISDASPNGGPRNRDTIQCFLAYSTTGLHAAAGNGTISATVQPDVPRNLVIEKTGAAGAGGSIGITGRDQFGNAIIETYTFPAGAATKVLLKTFASIDVNGITISGMTGGDKISVGVGNKLGLTHKIFTGAVKKMTKNGVGNYTNYTEALASHAVALGDNIVAADIYQIIYQDCLA